MRECLHQSLLIPVWIRAPGLLLYQCAMTFVSENGAELMVHDPFAMPDRFDLLFSPIAQSWRECSVTARRYEAKSIRVSFLGRHLPLYSANTASRVVKSATDQTEQQKWNRPGFGGSIK
jgi:hypothetical protein